MFAEVESRFLGNGWFQYRVKTLSDAEVAGLTNCPMLASPHLTPHIANIRVLGDGQILLEGAGSRFGLYHLEASTNLSDWNVIGAAEANGEGAFQFIDENTLEFPALLNRRGNFELRPWVSAILS